MRGGGGGYSNEMWSLVMPDDYTCITLDTVQLCDKMMSTIKYHRLSLLSIKAPGIVIFIKSFLSIH